MKDFHKIAKADWTPARMAYEWEKYNGFGYRRAGRPLSPYLWSGSMHYTKGKFVADHKYDPNAVSQQIGTMCLLKALKDLQTIPPYKEVVKNSRRLSFIERMKGFILWLSGLGGLSMATLEDAQAFVKDNASWILLGVGATWYLATKYIQYRSEVEIKEGRYQTKED
jgi:hypothetical protein